MIEIETQICDIYEFQKQTNIAFNETKTKISASLLDVINLLKTPNNDLLLTQLETSLKLANDLTQNITNVGLNSFDNRIDLVLTNVDKIKSLK